MKKVTSVSKKIENAWNDAWYNVKRDANKIKSLSFYGTRNKSSFFAPASVRVVSNSIKEATKRVEKAECIALDAVKAAKEAQQALNKTLKSVKSLKTTRTVVGAKTTKKRKTKNSTTAGKKTKKTRAYRAA